MSIRMMASSDLAVWMTRPEDACEPELLARHLPSFSVTERERWAAFRSETARLHFLVGRALVRAALSEVTGDPMERWQFTTERFGRPMLANDDRDLRFNLSHTDGLVACVVAIGRDVGIDVERHDTSTPVVELGRRFLPAEEAHAVADAPADARHARFYERWTLHESYAKARGTGLGEPRRDLVFRVVDGEPVAVSHGEEARRWGFWLLHPTPVHTLAVTAAVTSTPSARPTLRHVVSLAA